MQLLPTWVEINLDALVENVAAIRKRAGVQILVTIKAEAYGHGAVQVANAVEDQVDHFGVATVDEAVELRTAGVRKKILVLSPILEQEIPRIVEHGLSVTVAAFSFARKVSNAAVKRKKRIDIHIEVDTGMGRAGVQGTDAESLVERVAMLPGVRLAGVYTHFPSSDTDIDFTRRQIAEFNGLLDRLAKRGVEIPIVHSANSAAVIALPESRMQMVRPGLLIYGLVPGDMESPLAIRPVMSWKSRLVQVRDMPAGAPISYGRTFTTTRPSIVGIIPVGYGHGYPYRLSNVGEVLVGGRRAPVVGRVTMDMTMVDLTDAPEKPVVGDEVVLVGRQGDEEISVAELAARAGTIPYEILCGISKRVPRIYLRKGRVRAIKSLLGVDANPVGA